MPRLRPEVLMFAAFTCLAPGRAAAQGSDPAAAQALFDAGRKGMARGDYATACPQLAESHRLDPAIGTLLNLADCYEKSGKTASAWTRFLEAADVARALGQASREKTARARAAALEPKLAKLIVDVPAASRIPGLTVARDGVVVGEALWGVAAPVDPGEHTVTARAPGRREVVLKASLLQGSQTVSVPLLEAGPDAVAAVPPPSATPTAAPPPSTTGAKPPPSDAAATPSSAPAGTWQRPTSYALMGVGAVGLGVGTLFAFRAKSKNSDSLGQCRPEDPTACTSDGKSLRDDAKSAATLSTVFVGLGAAAAIGGVFLYLSSPSAPAATALRFGPGSVSLEGRFR